MVSPHLIRKVFSASYIQRWNDKLRPIDFVELDKHALKMIIAYIIGSFEQGKEGFSWKEIIEGCFFELLQKIVLTDIKSPVFYMIKEHKEKYRQLNEFVYNEIEPTIAPLGPELCDRFRVFFEQTDNTINKRILTASSTYASLWEFAIIRHSDPHGYDNAEIENTIMRKLQTYDDLAGMQQLTTHHDYQHFIDRCGELRYQIRWAGAHRIPHTSVLNHSLFVALFAYLFSLEVGSCPKRCYNNFFTGLFHDLPEVLTRDIISPIKRSVEGLKDILGDYEKQQMEKIIFPLLPAHCVEEMHMFTEREKEGVITLNGSYQWVCPDEINAQYNEDHFNPRDGAFIKLADELAAYVESSEALRNGCTNERFTNAMQKVKEYYDAAGVVGGINTKELFKDL
ncbi:MAG: YfbR-like 5'-deoxynucleotidase [Patescibacteria group bacterium]